VVLRVDNIMQYYGVIRHKDQYEVKWFIPLVELSLEDRLLSPGLLPDCMYVNASEVCCVFEMDSNALKVLL